MGNNNNSNMGGTGQNTYTSNTFYVDPRATFEAFFGTSNPFENFFNIHNSSSGLFTDHLNADHNNMTDNLDDPFAFSSLGGGLGSGFGHLRWCADSYRGTSKTFNCQAGDFRVGDTFTNCAN